jgi:hypothetical protein
MNSLTCHSTASFPSRGSADHCAVCCRCDHQTKRPETHNIFCSCHLTITDSTYILQREASNFEISHAQFMSCLHHHKCEITLVSYPGGPLSAVMHYWLFLTWVSLTHSLTHSHKGILFIYIWGQKTHTHTHTQTHNKTHIRWRCLKFRIISNQTSSIWLTHSLPF